MEDATTATEAIETSEIESGDVHGFDADALAEKLGDEYSHIFNPDSSELARRRAEEAAAEAELNKDDDDTSSPDAEEVDGDDKPATEAGDKPSQKEQKSDQEAAENAPKLDPLLRMAAKASEWSDEEIDKFFAADPEYAEKTFAKFRQSQSDLTARYAAMGRTALQQNQAPSLPQAPGAQAQQVPWQQEVFPQQPQQTQGGLDLNALYGGKLDSYKEKYGSEFIEEVINPLAMAVNRTLAQQLQPVHEVRSHYEAERREQIRTTINNHFKGLSAEFHDLYGNGQQVAGGQLEARMQAVKLADQIRTGAAIQGFDMSMDEALERAVAAHSVQHIEAIQRKKLTTQVKKRASQITQRPTQRKTISPLDTGQRSDEAAMQAYAARARELGWDDA